MNYGNIRLRMTLRINVGCLLVRSEMNGGNIRLRITLKRSEINGGKCRVFAFTVGNDWR